MIIHPAILDLSPEMSLIKPDCVKDDDVITHELKAMGNSLIIQPHKFEHECVPEVMSMLR
jgi:hypothetical protein